MYQVSENKKIVLDILNDEIKGDVKSAVKKLSPNYSMTWVYKSKNSVLFPKVKKNIKQEMMKVYSIKEREYDIKNIAEGKNIVMIEMVESYPNPKTKKIYRTPLVLIIEVKNGKIQKGRHYCDPNLSYMYLKNNVIDKIFK